MHLIADEMSIWPLLTDSMTRIHMQDTIKPIEADSYQHLVLAQEQEARNRKFDEDVHFESKDVRRYGVRMLRKP